MIPRLKSNTHKICVLFFISFLGLSLNADQTITLRSGNGTIGTTDSDITMLVGPVDAAFAGVFDSADFNSPYVGSPAHIITPNGGWLATLPSDTNAKWISTHATGAVEGSSALYAIDFVVICAVHCCP